MVEPKVVKFCTRVGYIILATASPRKGAWLWSRDWFKTLPFAVMQLVARVCRRQLSYLFTFCAYFIVDGVGGAAAGVVTLALTH